MFTVYNKNNNVVSPVSLVFTRQKKLFAIIQKTAFSKRFSETLHVTNPWESPFLRKLLAFLRNFVMVFSKRFCENAETVYSS